MRAVLLAGWVGCTGGASRTEPNHSEPRSSPSSGGPVQTEPPNAPDQKPAFPGQTRAPEVGTPTRFDKAEIARGLEHPWGIEELPDGRFLVTERPGRMRIVEPSGALGEPIAGLPEVDARDQGGLLDVALAPDFGTSRRIFWSYAEPRGDGKNGTSVASGVLSEDGRSVSEITVVFRQEPAWRSTKHFGSRLAFAPDGDLFVTVGERSLEEARGLAQDLGTHLGKVLRIRPDGTAPDDNPYVGRDDARPEIWSYGHRNLQSAAIDPSGRLWTVEHGPQGGDELNRPEPGKNYGWPLVTYGEDYGGGPIGEGITWKEGVEQPIYYWDPVIAPSGMAFYTGELFPAFRGDVLIGGLVAHAVVRLVLEDDRVAEEEWLDVGARVRDVKQASDGSLLVLTDEDDGKILRLAPEAG